MLRILGYMELYEGISSSGFLNEGMEKDNGKYIGGLERGYSQEWIGFLLTRVKL